MVLLLLIQMSCYVGLNININRGTLKTKLTWLTCDSLNNLFWIFLISGINVTIPNTFIDEIGHLS